MSKGVDDDGAARKVAVSDLGVMCSDSEALVAGSVVSSVVNGALAEECFRFEGVVAVEAPIEGCLRKGDPESMSSKADKRDSDDARPYVRGSGRGVCLSAA